MQHGCLVSEKQYHHMWIEKWHMSHLNNGHIWVIQVSICSILSIFWVTSVANVYVKYFIPFSYHIFREIFVFFQKIHRNPFAIAAKQVQNIKKPMSYLNIWFHQLVQFLRHHCMVYLVLYVSRCYVINITSENWSKRRSIHYLGTVCVNCKGLFASCEWFFCC